MASPPPLGKFRKRGPVSAGAPVPSFAYEGTDIAAPRDINSGPAHSKRMRGNGAGGANYAHLFDKSTMFGPELNK